MPPCVPPGLSDVPSTRTNRGGPSGSSYWGRPRECPYPPSTSSALNKSHVWMSVLTLMVQVFADTAHCFLMETGTAQCCWSVLWTLWYRGAFSTKAELWLRTEAAADDLLLSRSYITISRFPNTFWVSVEVISLKRYLHMYTESLGNGARFW